MASVGQRARLHDGFEWRPGSAEEIQRLTGPQPRVVQYWSGGNDFLQTFSDRQALYYEFCHSARALIASSLNSVLPLQSPHHDTVVQSLHAFQLAGMRCEGCGFSAKEK